MQPTSFSPSIQSHTNHSVLGSFTTFLGRAVTWIVDGFNAFIQKITSLFSKKEEKVHPAPKMDFSVVSQSKNQAKNLNPSPKKRVLEPVNSDSKVTVKKMLENWDNSYEKLAKEGQEKNNETILQSLQDLVNKHPEGSKERDNAQQVLDRYKQSLGSLEKDKKDLVTGMGLPFNK